MDFINKHIELNEKRQINIEITPNYSIPVWIIRGCADGRTLVITAGVHGCD